jgi:putative MATE family efflux protein
VTSGSGRGGREVWALAWPAILGNLLQTSVAAVAAVAIGQLGAVPLAASTVGERIFFALQAVLIAVTGGTTALVARAWGGGERGEAALLTRASLQLCVALAAGTSLVGMLFARELAGVFRLEAEALDLAARYVRWLLAFNPSFAAFLALASALRAAGDTRIPLLLGALANLLNVALVFPLVSGAFGLPGMGLPGAALAAGIAMTASTALFLWLWARGWLRIGAPAARVPARGRIAALLRIGYPAGLEQGVFQLGFIVFLWIVSFYGTEAYAAYGIGVRILSFSFVIGAGFQIAAATLVGQSLGAGDVALARRSGWRASAQSVLAMSAFGLLIALFAEPIARFTVDDDEVVRLSVAFIHIFGAVQPLMALEFALAGALRGAGDTRFPLYTALAGMFAVRATLAAFALWLELPVEWVFGALVGDYLAKSALLAWRFRSGRWQHAIGR